MIAQTLLPLAILLFLVSTWFVIHYAKRSTSCTIILLSILSFGLGSAAVALLPIDLSYSASASTLTSTSTTTSANDANDATTNDTTNNNTNNNNEEDIFKNNPTYLPWQITYWTTFFLAWLLLPITRETLLSGHFTLRQRLNDGITKSIRSLLLMIIMGILSIIGMAIHMQSFHILHTVLPVLMALGNTYGLVLVSLLLGNGLVTIPKRFWREACPEKELRRARIMACGAEEELFEAVWELEDVEKHVDQVCRSAVGLDLGNGGGVGGGGATGGRRRRGEVEEEEDVTVGSMEYMDRRSRATRCGKLCCCFNYLCCHRCTVDEVTQFHECLEELVRRKNETMDLNSDQRTGSSSSSSSSLALRHNTTTTTPPGSPTRNRADSSSDTGSHALAEEAMQNMDINYLVMLNAQLKRAQERVASAQLRWNHVMERNRLFSALEEENSSSGSSIGNHNRLQRLWVRHLRYHTFRIFAMITAVLSVFVLLSEVTLAAPMNLSPFSWVLHALPSGTSSASTSDSSNTDPEEDAYDGSSSSSNTDGASQGKGTEILFQICALIPLLYMSICVYTCLFQMSLLGPYCLRGNRQSHGVALVFNAQYLVRLQFPLGYNYLLMLKYDMTHCAFSNIMSDMSTIPFFGTSFSVYAPLLILAVCAFTLCDAYPKILHALGIEHEDSVLLGDADELESKVNEGIQLIQRDVERRGDGSSPDKYALVAKKSSSSRRGSGLRESEGSDILL